MALKLMMVLDACHAMQSVQMNKHSFHRNVQSMNASKQVCVDGFRGPYTGKVLAGWTSVGQASPNCFQSVDDAKAKCSELQDCGGFTQQRWPANVPLGDASGTAQGQYCPYFALRHSTVPSTDHGWDGISYVKCPTTTTTTTTTTPMVCVDGFKGPYQDKVLAGWTSVGQASPNCFQSVDDAKVRCLELQDCGGFTQQNWPVNVNLGDASGTAQGQYCPYFALRHSTTPSDDHGWNGISYVKCPGASATTTSATTTTTTTSTTTSTTTTVPVLIEGRGNTNFCPTGSVQILDEVECRVWSEANGYIYGGLRPDPEFKEKLRLRPKGCWVNTFRTHNFAYFNKGVTGGLPKDHRFKHRRHVKPLCAPAPAVSLIQLDTFSHENCDSRPSVWNSALDGLDATTINVDDPTSPLTPVYMKIIMGNYTDYYKPAGTFSFREMIASNTKHQWSEDGTTWQTPDYAPWHGQLGGSAYQYPSGNRNYLSYWGNTQPNLCGCCAPDWFAPFTVEFGVM